MIAEAMADDDRVRLINHNTPQGVGASFWEGVDQAKGEFICMLPGDNENDPREILRYYSLLEHVDMVIPFVFNREVRPFSRNLLSLVYRVIINTTFLGNFNYTNGTIMYRRGLLQELDFRSRGFFFQTDILIRTVKQGYLFAEVPYRLSAGHPGVSKAVTFPSFLRVAGGYLRLVRDTYVLRRNKQVARPWAEESQTARRRNFIGP